jgi:hypothetical protein
MQTGIEHLDGYTRAHLNGAPSLGQFLSFVELIAVDSRAWSNRRLLMDLSQVTSLTLFTDQMVAGGETGRKLAHLRRVAVVVGDTTFSRISEAAAQRVGLELRVFASEVEALPWLRR